MGLSILVFAAAAGIGFILVLVAMRGRGTAPARFDLVIDLCLIVFAVAQGLSSIGAASASYAGTILLWRVSTAAIVTAQILILGFAFSFPRWLWRQARFLPVLFVLAAAALIYYIFGSDACISGATFTTKGFIPNVGASYGLIRVVGAAFGLAAVIVHGIRAIQTDDSINRQRSALSLFTVLAGISAIFFFQGNSPAPVGDYIHYVLPSVVALAMSGLMAYTMAISRLFDWREFFRTLVGYAAVTVFVGLPTGGVVWLLVLLGSASVVIPILGAPILFFIAFRLAGNFIRRFFERMGSSREYREMLESTLAHIDLSAGRDAVIADLHQVLSESLGFQDFSIVIEDDRGNLKTTYSSTGGLATLERGDVVRAHIERSDVSVLMLSEAQADSFYLPIQKELLALFASLKAEALIIAREGRRIIGIFALGQRKMGGEYTDYDYDTFRSIGGKLFVFAFYLKNVARESILYTVDRELALSDQIIRFALEHVAPVNNPRADAAWAMRSTRSLGGDFVDFVRIGKERYFFVLGDVSGKGLSASMNMLILKSMIRTFLRIEKDFAGLVQRVNAFIKEYLPKGSFFAGVFGYFDFEKGSLYFINCGVPAILLYSPSFDAFIEVQGEGKILGFVRDVSPYIKPRKLSLSPGTALVLSTDGLLDSENIRGERFGKERLRKAASDRLEKSAREVADGVIEDLIRFTDNKQEDDITLLVMKIK